MCIRRALLLLAAALALADASIVTLALPPIIDELDASVEGAAAVLGVYTLVLAVALPFVPRLRVAAQTLGARRRRPCSPPPRWAAGWPARWACCWSLRALQAGGAAVVLVAVFELVDGGGAGRRAWNAAAVFGFAAGPGARRRADPGARLAGDLPRPGADRARASSPPRVSGLPRIARVDTAPRTGPARRPQCPGFEPTGTVTTLALVSAALTGVLFLLVLLLVTGWSKTPLAAAATVTVLPIAAIPASRIKGPARPGPPPARS